VALKIRYRLLAWLQYPFRRSNTASDADGFATATKFPIKPPDISRLIKPDGWNLKVLPLRAPVVGKCLKL
jgi:hypothetical protein